jgi:hypothetical protein
MCAGGQHLNENHALFSGPRDEYQVDSNVKEPYMCPTMAYSIVKNTKSKQNLLLKNTH